MKNLYALNEKLQLIKITEVIKSKKELYICCNCEKELIPRKGNVKVHHFSHKSECNCSYESYLHKLSKIKFYSEYLKCLNNKESFYIEYKTNNNCLSCKEIDGLNLNCNLEDEIKKFDLTCRFDKISIEKSFNGFIADILLESSINDEKLFIEFAVSHRCEVEKIESKIRIIEIILKNDSDLEFISDRKIKVNQENIIFYNFKTKQNNGMFINPLKCNKEFESLIVYNNNKVIRKDIMMKNIMKLIENKTIKHIKILEPSKNIVDNKIDEYEYKGSQQFIDFVIKYSYENKDFKNCYSCNFFAENKNKFLLNELGYKFFCKKFKTAIESSNEGHNCDKYWRIKK